MASLYQRDLLNTNINIIKQEMLQQMLNTNISTASTYFLYFEKHSPATCGPNIPEYKFTEHGKDRPAVHLSVSSWAHSKAVVLSLSRS